MRLYLRFQGLNLCIPLPYLCYIDLLDMILQVFRHLIQTLCKKSHFVVGLDRHPRIQIPVLDLFHGILQCADGLIHHLGVKEIDDHEKDNAEPYNNQNVRLYLLITVLQIKCRNLFCHQPVRTGYQPVNKIVSVRFYVLLVLLHLRQIILQLSDACPDILLFLAVDKYFFLSVYHIHPAAVLQVRLIDDAVKIIRAHINIQSSQLLFVRGLYGPCVHNISCHCKIADI